MFMTTFVIIVLLLEMLQIALVGYCIGKSKMRKLDKKIKKLIEEFTDVKDETYSRK